MSLFPGIEAELAKIEDAVAKIPQGAEAEAMAVVGRIEAALTGILSEFTAGLTDIEKRIENIRAFGQAASPAVMSTESQSVNTSAESVNAGDTTADPSAPAA